jgi:hypothetical protein
MTIRTKKNNKLLLGGKYTKKLISGGARGKDRGKGNTETQIRKKQNQKNKTLPTYEELNEYLKYIIDNYNDLLKKEKEREEKKGPKNINRFEELLYDYEEGKERNKNHQFNINIIKKKKN